ncbi:hypothetical protein LTR15_012489 [Elasticomyces elasticus]|nr:hypothetical protein LTR15_012489 [Elasticomyces elasticus]
MARSMDRESSSDDVWSVASDESGMFETYAEPSQDLHQDHRLTPASQSHLAGPSLSKDPQDIRLIILDLSIDNYEPQLSYRLTNLGSPTPYYALSYAWGQLYSDNSHLDATVRLEGAPVKVTSRLHEALFQIRARAIQSAKNSLLASGAIALWIDALCIDQLNAVERNRQVSIMGDIFARAQAVGQRATAERRYRVRHSVGDDLSSRLLQASMAGNYLMGLEMLQKAIVISKHDMPVCFSSFTSTSVRVQTLLENMILHSELKCFDHRDRVFAMLAISADDHGIVPDYNVDYTVVYIQLAVTYLRKG